MRNPDRLDVFYEKLKNIHKKYASDWRFGQFIINVFGSFTFDPWFYEEDKMMECIEAFFERGDNKE